MCLAIKTTVSFDSIRSLYFVLYKFVSKQRLSFQCPPLTTSKRISKSYREYLKLFDPAFHSYNLKHLKEKKTTQDRTIFSVPVLESKYRVFEILGILIVFQIQGVKNLAFQNF